MILIIILHALFALSFPLARLAVQSAEPIFFTGFRMVVAGIILLLWQKFRNVDFIQEFKSNILAITSLALFNVFLTNSFEFWSLKYMSSSKAAFIYSISPFLTALLAYLIIHEKITKKKLLGMATGFFGFLFMLFQSYPAETAVGGFGFISWPEITMILAALATTIGWISMRYVMKNNTCSVISANGLSMFIGGIFSFIASLYIEPWKPLPIENYFLFFKTALLLITVSNIVCYNLYSYLLKFYTPTLLSFSGFIEPIFAALFGWLLLAETVSWQFVVAFIIVIFGLYIFYSDELNQR